MTDQDTASGLSEVDVLRHRLKQRGLLLKAALIGPIWAVLRQSEGETLRMTKQLAAEIEKEIADD